MASSLGRRITVAAIGIPLAFGAVYLGAWALVAAVALLGAIGSAEFYRLSEAGGARPLAGWGLAAAVAFPVGTYATIAGLVALPPVAGYGAAALWLLAVMGAAIVRRGPEAAPLAAMAATVFGACYAAGLPSFLLVLRHGEPSMAALPATWLVFYPLAMTWICDTAAMSGGAAFGGPKMAPVLSPKKTWSGAVSGLFGALIVAIVYGLVALAPSGIILQVWQMIVLGLAVGTLGQVGDLGESLLKRSVGIKDSGSFFPGHGGVLDRLDSLYWVIPITTLLLVGFGIL